MPTLDVTFHRSVDEYIAFQMHALNTSKSLRRRQRVAGLSIPFASALAGFLCLQRPDLINFAYFFFALAGVSLIFYPYLLRWRIAQMLKKLVSEAGSRGIEADVRHILTDNSITQIVDDAKSEYPWRTVDRIDETPTHAFLFVTPMSALIWPRKRFRTEDEYQQVVDFAKERLRHFHGNQ